MQTQLRSQQKATCLVFARSEDYFVAYDVMGDGGSVLHLLRAAMPRVPLEDNPRMTWRDFVPLRGLVGRLSPVQVLTPFLKTGGLETQYQLYRDGARWVYYRQEPAPLNQRRMYIQQAPPASRRYSATPPTHREPTRAAPASRRVQRARNNDKHVDRPENRRGER